MRSSTFFYVIDSANGDEVLGTWPPNYKGLEGGLPSNLGNRASVHLSGREVVQVLLYPCQQLSEDSQRILSPHCRRPQAARVEKNSVKLDRVIGRKTTIYYGRPAASFQKGPDLCPAYLPLAGWTLAELKRDPKLADWLRQSTSGLVDN